MRKVFTSLTAVLLATVAIQFFLAAMGAFDSASRDESFAAHRGLGFLIVLLALITTVTAAVARIPGRVVGLTATVLGLVVLQPVLAGVSRAIEDADDGSRAAELAFGLHGVNGLAIAALLSLILRRSRA